MFRNVWKWILIAALTVSPTMGFAEVDMEMLQTLNLPDAPLDAVMAPRSSYMYVLTRSGNVVIYDGRGEIKDRLSVGSDVKALAMGPSDDILLLIAPDTHQVRVIQTNFVYTINTSGSPFRGNPDAPVTVVVFSDFQCPYCSRLVPLLDEVFQRNRDKIKIVFKNFPLRIHSYAVKAATAALAAGTMGKFWEFHNRLFENFNQLSDAKVDQIAKELDIDPVALKKREQSPAVLQALQQDIKDAKAADVHSTPTVFINGRELKRRSPEAFQQMIDTALQKAANRK